MHIYNENSHIEYLDHLTAPVTSSFFWTLDLLFKDFKLSPLTILEEYTAPALLIETGNCIITIPTNWKILIYDEGTSYLDVIEVYELTTNKFKALVYGPDCFKCQGTFLKVIDYTPSTIVVTPGINKHQMLCYPITDTSWIIITPNNIYNKYIRYMAVGDII